MASVRWRVAALLLLSFSPSSLQQESSSSSTSKTPSGPPDPNIVISSVQVSTSPIFVRKPANPRNRTKPSSDTPRSQRQLANDDFYDYGTSAGGIPSGLSNLFAQGPGLAEFSAPSGLGHLQPQVPAALRPDYYFRERVPNAPPPPPMCALNVPQCQPDARYRTLDGSCNNLKNPNWGMTGSLFTRLVPPRYADGLDRPVEEGLPLARVLSASLFPDVNIVDHTWTLVAMQWAQTVTHDMSMAAGSRQHKPHKIRCCAQDGHDLARDLAAQAGCYPIRIPQNDPFYGRHNQRCMDFTRSSNDVQTGCNVLGPAQQMTAVSSYLDLSLVYGSNEDTQATVREFRAGRLIADIRKGRQWLPESANRSADCDTSTDDEPCYRSGDVRVNQNPGQALVQTLLLREHNHLAAALAKINPHWDDDTIFQEARRINIAQFQHVTYYEWLPILLGFDNTMHQGLIQQDPGYSRDYDENTDATAINDHAAGAFRHLHTLITGDLLEVDPLRQGRNANRLSDFFNRPVIIEQNDNLDHFVRGLATQPQHAPDRFFTAEITQFLFRAGKAFGGDLRSIDIQRGRDHGLPGYNEYRQLCGLPRARTFADFADVMDHEAAEALGQLYNNVDDVDMLVGGGLEHNAPGALAGPTFVCIMAEQFRRTRQGDRFWFELEGQPSTFTPGQLAELRKTSLARLFCNNGDHIQAMQHYAFKRPSHSNEVISCNDIPEMDLSYWQAEVPHVPQTAHASLHPQHTSLPFSIYGKK